MPNIFEKVLTRVGRRSKLDLSHDVKTTGKMGELMCTCLIDTLPSDKFHISVESQIRFPALIAPIFHRVKVKHEFFHVELRLLWPDWEKWITGELEVLPPTVLASNSWTKGTKANTLFFPAGAGANNNNTEVSAFPIAAYNKIWNDWYRDENLQNEKNWELVAGNNTWAYTDMGQPLNRRAWMGDYRTSGLPFAQKGSAVAIPLVETDIVLKGPGNIGAGNIVKDPSTGQPRTADDVVVAGTGELHVGAQGQSVIDPNGAWEVPAQTTPMENLRRAWALQTWLEKNARAGTRYVEFLLSHFNQSNGDARMWRADYVGSTTHNMIISEVLATAQDESATNAVPVGQQAGHGIAIGRSKGFKYKVKDYGLLFGFTSVTPMTAYTNNLPRMHRRLSYLDYFIPSFQNIGEQEVYNYEVYWGSESKENLEKTFSYINRYAEYKYVDNRVTGEFGQGESLEFYHLGRTFDVAPALNEDFIQCTPSNRIFALTDYQAGSTDHLWVFVYNKITALRPMVKYAMPEGFGPSMY